MTKSTTRAPIACALVVVTVALACSASTADAAIAPFVVVYKTAGANDVPRARVDEATDARERALGFRASLRLRSASIRGFAARLSTQDVEQLRRDPSVATIAPDRLFKALGKVPRAPQETVPTGIGRVGAAGTVPRDGAGAGSLPLVGKAARGIGSGR